MKPLLSVLLIAGVLSSALAVDPVFDRDLLQLLEEHPQLRAAAAQAEAARAKTEQADTLPDPVLQVSRFVESVQTRTGPQETVFMLSQQLPWFGVRGEKRDAASADADAVSLERNALELQLSRELADAFYAYAFLGKATGLSRENLDLLEALEPIVQTRVAAGESLNALLRLKVESAHLRDELASLGERRRKQSAVLDSLLNQSGAPLRPWPVWAEPEITQPDAIKLRERLLRNHPELSALASRMDATHARERLAALAGYPDFSFGATYIQTGDPEVNPSTPDAGNDPWSVTAAIRIPLWRSDIHAKKVEASQSVKSATARHAAAALKLEATLTGRLADLSDAQRRMQVYGGELLDLARQAVENSRAGYENGSVGILEVIDSERTLLGLQLEYWRAVADARVHHLHLRSLTEPDLESLLSSKESQ